MASLSNHSLMQACDFKFTARIGDIEKTVDNFSLAKPVLSSSKGRKERKVEMCLLLHEIISLPDSSFAGLAPLR